MQGEDTPKAPPLRGLEERTQDVFSVEPGETTAYADMRAVLQLALDHVNRAEESKRGCALCLVVIRGTYDESRRVTAVGEAQFRMTEGFEGRLAGEKVTAQVRMLDPSFIYPSKP